MISASTKLLSQIIVISSLALMGCGKADTPADRHPAAVGTHASSEAHSHSRSEDHSVILTAPAGERWATDEPLRASMTRLRSAIEARQSGEIDANDARALAAIVEAEVAFMIANCKLPPQPDAALHILIGRMLSSVTELRKSPPDAEAVSDLAFVLHDYAQAFDHPGWTL